MINSKLSEISTLIANSLYYKTNYKCKEDIPLILLSKANTSCLDKYELKNYNNKLNSLLFDCIATQKEVSVDNTNREDWEVNNPSCVSRKQWEKIALKICQQYKIDVIVENIDKACDIAFDITKKIIDCDVLTAISIQQKMCDLNIKVDTNIDKCSAEYKLLIEKYPECNLTKKEYITLMDKNFSYEVLSSIYDKKLKLEVDSRGNTTLVSPVNNYDIQKDLQFKEIIVDSKTKDLTLPKKILNDYKLTNNIKQKILNEIYFI